MIGYLNIEGDGWVWQIIPLWPFRKRSPTEALWVGFEVVVRSRGHYLAGGVLVEGVWGSRIGGHDDWSS